VVVAAVVVIAESTSTDLDDVHQRNGKAIADIQLKGTMTKIGAERDTMIMIMMMKGDVILVEVHLVSFRKEVVEEVISTGQVDFSEIEITLMVADLSDLSNVNHKIIVERLGYRDPSIGPHLVEEGRALDRVSTHLSFVMSLCGLGAGTSETNNRDRLVSGIGLTFNQIIGDQMIVSRIRDIGTMIPLSMTGNAGEYTVSHQTTIVHQEWSIRGHVQIMILKLVPP